MTKTYTKWRLLFTLILIPFVLFGDDFDNASLQSQNPTPYTNHYNYQPSNKFAYLGVSTGIILGGTLVGAGALYLMPESFTNWDKKEIANLDANWRRKVSQGPVVDADDWFLNWITHPYWGAVYYMQPRVAGFSWAESALYSVLASAFFWEYGIEAFAEVPSWQDLVITPAIGSIFGELFYRATLHIHSNQDRLLGSRILGKSTLLLMDPVGFLLQNTGLARFFGVQNKNDIQGMVMPLSGKNGSGMQMYITMRF